MIVKMQLSFLIVGIGLTNIFIIDAAKWSYEGDTGPEHWSSISGGQHCDGSSQSPINIMTDNVVERKMGIFEFDGYDEMTMTGSEIHNNGHTVQINVAGNFRVTGGGLPSIYKAVQFHFHWGRDDNEGSEHTLNGNQYPAEIHIVHYDSEKYDDILAAITEPEGLAVLGFWVELGEENPAFDPIFEVMKNLTYKGDIVYFADDRQLKLNQMLPINVDKFFRYSGSLTTPGCFESVEWTMFEQPITMSKTQINMFRDLKTEKKGVENINNIRRNYRPVQDIDGRPVYTNTLFSLGGGADSIHSNIVTILLLAVLCVLIRL